VTGGMPRISVALCTHNGARWLGEQLESIAAQTRTPHELVVCDDASTDDTLRVARDFASRAPFAVQVHANAAPLGVAGNFSGAMGRCAGDWIAFADQDDVWRPDKLEVLARAAEGTGADLVFSDADCVDAALRPLGYSVWDAVGFTGSRRAAWESGGALDVLLWRNVVTGTCAMLRTSRRDELLPIGAGWIHDGWCATLLASYATVVAVPERLVAYRQHGTNQVGARSLTLGDRAQHARETPRDEYRAQHDALARLRAHASSLAPRLAFPERARLAAALARIDDKLAHLDARASLAPHRVRRLPSVTRELLTGRYRRYASGTLSAVRDLVW
jgi:glycosyltransferase involved in cell wall biosynthesis